MKFFSFIHKNKIIELNELKHLSEFFTKKGEKFVNDLLSKELTINIKIDVTSFNIKVENGEVVFYGREGRQPINLIKRITTNLYEEPIKHITSRPLDKLENGLEIYMEYFNDKLPTLIKYYVKPKNNLIISFIKKNGKILMPTDPLVEKISKILDIETPPILFSGKLNKKQKDKLLQFISLKDDEKIIFLEKNYQGSFITFVLSLFFDGNEIKFLKASGLEGLVFYFKNGDEILMSKITDPIFTKKVKEKKKSSIESKNNEYLKKLIDIIFVPEIEEIAFNILRKKENYYSFIYKLTLAVFKKFKSKLENKLRKYENEINEFPFGVNEALIPSKLKNMFKKYFYLKDIYRLYLTQFSKPKKRALGNFDKKKKELINKINKLLTIKKIILKDF